MYLHTCSRIQPEFEHEVVNGVEVTYEGHTREKGDQEPGTVLCSLCKSFADAPGFPIQLDALVPRAFEALFHPHEDAGPNGLRAAVATPYTPGENGNREQGKGRDDQQKREQGKILWPQGKTEDVEFAFGQVEPDRRLAVDAYPRQAKVGDEQRPARVEPKALVEAFDLSRVDLFPFLVEVEFADLGWRDLLEGYAIGVFRRRARRGRVWLRALHDGLRRPAGPSVAQAVDIGCDEMDLVLVEPVLKGRHDAVAPDTQRMGNLCR